MYEYDIIGALYYTLYSVWLLKLHFGFFKSVECLMIWVELDGSLGLLLGFCCEANVNAMGIHKRNQAHKDIGPYLVISLTLFLNRKNNNTIHYY